ncbi:T9SS type A sorting domain-containing protein [Wenyingzhuangia sp. IMCC45467]
MKKITSTILLMLASTSFFAQSTIIAFEAESGNFSATTDYEILTEGEITYIAPKTDLLNGDFPASADKVVTYNVTFAEAGTYDLYGKMYIGPGGATDDSFFNAAGFGVQDVNNADHWVKQNETNRHGYSSATDYRTIVDGNYITTDSKNEEWKWINLSQMLKSEVLTNYTVANGNSTLQFQVGAREDGLRFDKFAFGKTGVEFTVSDLDSAPVSLGFNQNVAKVTANIYTVGNTVSVSNITEVTEIEVYSITGALVKSLSTKADTSFNLNPGVWIATLKTAEGQKSVKILCN